MPELFSPGYCLPKWGLRSTQLVVLTSCLVSSIAPIVNAQAKSAAHKEVAQLVDEKAANYKRVSQQIWNYAELGYHEEKSSALLQAQLKDAGFSVESGVADEPTAFIASYGQGKPVIGILGEFDALPGLSQKPLPQREPLVPNAPGHGCGHNLLGSGAALAAVAVREYMETNHVSGTLRYYGTPAEEGGSGKVFMVRAGLFKDVDVVLHWHPGDHNSVNNGGMLAVISAKVTFHGIAAHAAMAPERGRSALDAVMLMGNGIEFMREHVPSNSRIHYIITKGGVAPNIVPDLAQMDLVARNPSNSVLADIWDRLLKISQGAALMTGTTVEVTDVRSDANIIGNDALAPVAQKNLEEVGGFTMSETEMAFALEMQKTLSIDSMPSLDDTHLVEPLRPVDLNAPSASTDVGDVSWTAPTIGFTTATFVPGVAPHTWQASASAGMSIGQQGMVVASKALAFTAIDLFANPSLVQDARADFDRKLTGKTYHTFIPAGQKPPINYRAN
jgi:aminobenzoyl-glutamate utilization protein B